jgi:putative zinc finger/helix-turn-helix YgiT family protein
MNRDSMARQGSGPRCECCPTGQLKTQFRQETIEHESESGTISIPADRVPVSVCDTCGSIFVTAETARVRHEYVCRAIGAITPAEIRAIRDRHGLSQSEFSRVTKFGEASISRWERGRLLPSPSNNKYLKLLLHHPRVVEWLLESESCTEVDETPVLRLLSNPMHRFRHLPTAYLKPLSEKAARFALVGSV